MGWKRDINKIIKKQYESEKKQKHNFSTHSISKKKMEYSEYHLNESEKFPKKVRLPLHFHPENDTQTVFAYVNKRKEIMVKEVSKKHKWLQKFKNHCFRNLFSISSLLEESGISLSRFFCFEYNGKPLSEFVKPDKKLHWNKIGREIDVAMFSTLPRNLHRSKKRNAESTKSTELSKSLFVRSFAELTNASMFYKQQPCEKHQFFENNKTYRYNSTRFHIYTCKTCDFHCSELFGAWKCRKCNKISHNVVEDDIFHVVHWGPICEDCLVQHKDELPIIECLRRDYHEISIRWLNSKFTDTIVGFSSTKIDVVHERLLIKNGITKENINVSIKENIKKLEELSESDSSSNLSTSDEDEE